MTSSRPALRRGPPHSALVEAPSPMKPSLEPVGTSRGQAQKCTPEEGRRKATFKYRQASATNPNRLLPSAPSKIRPHPALGCRFLSPWLTRPSAQWAWRLPAGPALGKGLLLLRHRAARSDPALVCRPDLVPALCGGASREAPASVPGLGRDPVCHEAGGLRAAPRHGQGEAAAGRRGTGTAGTPGPPGCGDERGGDGG